MTYLEKADLWAANVWKMVVGSWEDRQQDYNYRRFLARPGVKKAMRILASVKDGVFLDLGCGDGSEMRHVRRVLVKQGNSGKFFGFDLQNSLIKIAKSKTRKSVPIKMIFDAGELQGLVKKYNLVNKVDRVFSTFLLQELSDEEKYFRLSANCLKESGQGIFLFLHPAFGTAMLKKKAVKINKDLGKAERWRWAAEYPIVEESGKTFFVPYFHREPDDYLKVACKYFSEIEIIELQPSKRVIEKCVQKHLSPFYDHPENIYYPEITQMPSALIFVVRK